MCLIVYLYCSYMAYNFILFVYELIVYHYQVIYNLYDIHDVIHVSSVPKYFHCQQNTGNVSINYYCDGFLIFETHTKQVIVLLTQEKKQ